MKTTYKIILSSVAQYIIIGLGMLYISSAFHEILHLKLLALLGGDGYIVLRGFYMETVPTTPTTLPFCMYIVAASGILVALLYALFAYVGYKRRNVEYYTALIPAILMQLVYGITETIFWQLPAEPYFAIATPVTVTTAIISLIISVYLLYKHVKRQVTP